MSAPLVILAAGGSRRLGRMKQLLQYQGESLLRRSVRIGLQSEFEPVVVVLGCEAEHCAREIEDLACIIVRNDQWRAGMASSIRAGVAAALAHCTKCDGLMIALCDQPRVTAEYLDAMLETQQRCGYGIVASRYDDTVGVPAYFTAAYVDSLQKLEGDRGGKALIAEFLPVCGYVEFPGGGVDIDTEGDYRALIENQ